MRRMKENKLRDEGGRRRVEKKEGEEKRNITDERKE